ncbi:unnamed protein product [Prunus armeniaca]
MSEKQVTMTYHEEQSYISETTSPMAPLGSHDHIQSLRLSSPYELSGDISSSMRNTQAFDRTPLKWRNLDDVLAQCNLCIMEPEKFNEATKDESWMKAMEDELSMIEKNATWELVDRPTDKPIIGVKWVFKTKLNLHSSVQKNKARLVAKEEEVYVDQPNGFVVKMSEDKVYKLHKALQSEATLYTNTRGEAEILIVSIYVDDIVYIGNSQSMLEEFRKDIMVKYEMTDLGLLHHFLGMRVIQIHTITTEKLSKDDGSGPKNKEQYRKIVGSLLYLTTTRPDVMYAASLLARFMHCPTNKHYGTAKRVLKYVQGTLDYGLEYVKGRNAVLIGYCDSDWGGSVDDSKSTSRYVFSFGNGVFAWASVKQNCVALSTTEAEYISASEATAQAIWLRFVLEDFGEFQAEATPTILLNCHHKESCVSPENQAH